jgi:addiction module HigA family antidote
MLMTKRKPASVGDIVIEEFMAPMGLTQAALAEAMGVQRERIGDRVEFLHHSQAVLAGAAEIQL